MRRCKLFPIEVTTGHVVYSTYLGTVKFTCVQGSSTRTFSLSDVYYTPDIPSPLISVACLRKKGFVFSNAKEGVAEVKDKNGRVILSVREQHNIYPIETWRPVTAKSTVKVISLMEAHRMFGHAAADTIRIAAKRGMFSGVKIDIESKIEDCKACLKG